MTIRARSSVQPATRGAQNQWTTTLPAASFGAGTSYSQSSLGQPAAPVSEKSPPTAGSAAGAGFAGGAGLPGAGGAG
ncbi:MAG TPA: hypothetical protein VGD80_28860 [Kofleriaceae bacterium]